MDLRKFFFFLPTPQTGRALKGEGVCGLGSI